MSSLHAHAHRRIVLDHQKCKLFLFVSLALLLTFSPLLNREAHAQNASLTLEKEQNWKTFETGSTCILGTGNVFLKDVDDDDAIEIITGGAPGQLRIWNWDGRDLTVEKNYEWQTTDLGVVVLSVYASDVDGDGVIEIITAGVDRNSTRSYAQLVIWCWDGDNLMLETRQEWCTVEDTARPVFFLGWENSVMSVCAADVDGDGRSEIITSGRAYDDARFNAQLRIWSWDSYSLALETSREWCAAKEALVLSTYTNDVDRDGITEIVTSGFDNNAENSSGQLRIWRWNGETLILEKSQEWQIAEGTALSMFGNVMGNTVANTIKAADVDGDGVPEIVTAGFAHDGALVNGQLRIWSWDGWTLTLEKSHEWFTANTTEVKSLSLEDVDGDGKQEIATSGLYWNGTHSSAQLRVWSWDGETLALENSQDWISGLGTNPWNLATSDIDKDGVMEIITVGCTHTDITSQTCDGHLRIWSISSKLVPPPNEIYIIIASVAIIITFAGTYLYMKKKRSLQHAHTTSWTLWDFKRQKNRTWTKFDMS
jgi:hypothetical protein